MYCVETTDLSHAFSANEKILDNINLKIPAGAIYGFLGPNGAGKTTTLRLILGLLKKQQGTISIFGRSFGSHRVDILRKTGSLIESPSVYGHLTAVENLRLLQKVYQCGKERISEVLTLVGLPDTGKKKTSQFSLGMKQRLSIAISLLNDPSLLILDEPTNGLDPNGIIEIRELLRKLNREDGITIIISSHLLAEIERLVTHTGIINKGRMMFEGPLETLINRTTQSSRVVIETNNAEKALQIIIEHDLSAKREDNNVIMPVTSKEKVAAVNYHLVSAGIEVYQITTTKDDLENIFMGIINN